MKFEEISKELDIPLRKVRKIYFKAISKLRNNLTEEEREYLKELLKESPKEGEYELLNEVLFTKYGKDNFD